MSVTNDAIKTTTIITLLFVPSILSQAHFTAVGQLHQVQHVALINIEVDVSSHYNSCAVITSSFSSFRDNVPSDLDLPAAERLDHVARQLHQACQLPALRPHRERRQVALLASAVVGSIFGYFVHSSVDKTALDSCKTLALDNAKNIKTLHSAINTLEVMAREQKYRNKFSFYLGYFRMLTDELIQHKHDLLSGITSLQQGHLPEHLIQPENLQKPFSKLQNLAVHTNSKLLSDSLYQLYQYPATYSVSSKSLVITLHVPLLSNTYVLSKLDLPFLTINSSLLYHVKTPHSYLAHLPGTNSYFTMDTAFLSTCLKFAKHHLCNFDALYKSVDDSCTAALFFSDVNSVRDNCLITHQAKPWFVIRRGNIIHAYSKLPLAYTIYCNGSATHRGTIQSYETLSVPADCIFDSSKIKSYPLPKTENIFNTTLSLTLNAVLPDFDHDTFSKIVNSTTILDTSQDVRKLLAEHKPVSWLFRLWQFLVLLCLYVFTVLIVFTIVLYLYHVYRGLEENVE